MAIFERCFYIFNATPLWHALVFSLLWSLLDTSRRFIRMHLPRTQLCGVAWFILLSCRLGPERQIKSTWRPAVPASRSTVFRTVAWPPFFVTVIEYSDNSNLRERGLGVVFLVISYHGRDILAVVLRRLGTSHPVRRTVPALLTLSFLYSLEPKPREWCCPLLV